MVIVPRLRPGLLSLTLGTVFQTNLLTNYKHGAEYGFQTKLLTNYKHGAEYVFQTKLLTNYKHGVLSGRQYRA